MKIKKRTVRLLGILLAALVLAVLCVIYFGRIVDLIFFIIKVLLPFMIAYILSIAVNPAVEKLRARFRLPKQVAAVLVIIVTVGIIGGAAAAGIWKIASEMKSIYTHLPEIYKNAADGIANFKLHFADIYSAFPQDIKDVLASIGNNIQTGAAEFLNNNYKPVVYGAGNFAKALPSIFIAIIVFILSLYFMMSDPETVDRAIRRIIPEKTADGFHNVWIEIKKYLGGYVKAQLIIMMIAFIIICLGLTVLEIRYAMLIALIIAILDALPFFGSGTVLIPWAVICFINSDIKLGIGMLIIYLAVIFTRQMIEPKIVSTNIGINPLFTLMAMYIGYKLFSIGGLIIGPIILMLLLSFYKAGAFRPCIRVFLRVKEYIKNETREMMDDIKKR